MFTIKDSWRVISDKLANFPKMFDYQDKSMHKEVFPYNYYTPELYYDTKLGSITETAQHTDSTKEEFK